jgi:hypothetical protein
MNKDIANLKVEIGDIVTGNQKSKEGDPKSVF